MYYFKRVANVLYERAVEDSANYAEQNMKDCLMFFDEVHKMEMYSYAVDQITIDGIVAEFGVYEGYSIDKLARLIPNKIIYGFDSFTGLQEDWNGSEWKKGGFNVNGQIPNIEPKNVEFIKGYFDETLPKWIKDKTDPFALINIDCDTYNATKAVLDNIGPSRIIPGTVIIFDEYFGYPGWREHEYKAWQEFVKKYNINYEYKALNHLQVLVKVL